MNAAPDEPPIPFWRGAGAVALVAALLGGTIGLYHCDWQAIVEPAQVLAGTVQYPPENPYGQRHLLAWSLVSQIAAAFLALGVSEAAVSIAVSALMGAAYAVPAALVAFALCRSFWLALVASVAAFHLFGAAMPYNPAYPIELVGTIHSNGVLGQSMALLCVALAGLGKPRLAAFCCALAPAVHVTWGLWAIGTIGAALAWERLDARCKKVGENESRPDAACNEEAVPPPAFSSRWLPAILAGALVTGASLAWQLWLARGVPAISADEKERYLRAMLDMWDFHRARRVMPFEAGMLLTAASAVFCGVWLARYRRTLPTGAARLLRALLIAGTTAYALAVLAPWLPEVAIRAIPARFITLNLLALPALLPGLIAIASGDAGCRLVLAFHLAYLAGHRLVMPGVSWNVNETLAAGALAAVLALANRGVPAARRLPGWLAGASALAFGLMAAGALQQAAREGDFATIPSRHDAALAAASEGEGMLIVAADLELIQLKTRRPVLVFGWMLDDLVYFPNLAPETNRILKRVYEVDLLDPEHGLRNAHLGKLAPDPGPWEARRRPEWFAIGREFAATQVLAPSPWGIDLPRVAASDRYALYAIPGKKAE